MKQIIIIIINAHRLLESVVVLAALIKKLPKKMGIHIIPADSQWFIDDTLETDLDVIQKKIYHDKVDPLIYLLDIGPDKFNREGLLKFNDKHSDKIIGWIGRDWEEYDTREINQFGGVLKSLPPEKPLSFGVEELGFNVRSYLIEDDKILSSGDEKSILENSTLCRIYKAFNVSEIIMENTEQDFLLTVVTTGAQEIITGFNEKIISDLSGLWEEMNNLTEKALKKMTDDHFPQAKLANRPIGYLDYGPAPEFTNFKDILNRMLESYPFMSVVRYQMEGHDFVRFKSNKFSEKKLIPFIEEDIDLKSIFLILESAVMRYEDHQTA